MVALFSFILVCRRLMGNSYENVGRFGKSPSGRFKKSSYKFSFLLVRSKPMGNSYKNLGLSNLAPPTKCHFMTVVTVILNLTNG